MRTVSLLVLATTGLLTGSGLLAPAHADPKLVGNPIVIVCDNGHTYEAVVSGNGSWTPAHDLDSNTMLIPTAFAGEHFTVTDAEGNVLEEEFPEDRTKSADKDRATSTSCTFSFSDTFEDPELGLLTVSGSGSVTGFTTPVT